MKRDYGLIRKILLDIEKAAPGKATIRLPYNDYESIVIYEHVKLLLDANLLDGEIEKNRPDGHYIIRGLTWKGYDFIDNARNETIWKKVMADAEKKGMSLSMSVLNGLLTKAAEKYMGLT